MSRTVFAQAGFLHGELIGAGRSDAATNEDCVEQREATETAAARRTPREAHIVPESIDLHDYMDVDVALHDELNYAKIRKSARAASDATSSQDDQLAHGLLAPLTASEVMDSGRTLRRVFLCVCVRAPMTVTLPCNFSQTASNTFCHCWHERKIKQTKITNDFLKFWK